MLDAHLLFATEEEWKSYMRIWIFNHYASMQFRDKSGRHYWFSKELDKRGYKPTVFCASTYHDSNERLDLGKHRQIIQYDEGINTPFVFVKVQSSIGNGIDRIWNMLGFYRNLFSATQYYSRENGRPDVIIASSVHPLTMVAGIKIARKYGVPCICEIRDLWPEAIFSFGKVKEKSLLGKLLVKGEHWIYRKANALIFTKEGDTDYLVEKGWTTEQGGDITLEKCYYINNGIDMDVFNKRVKEIVIAEGEHDLENTFIVTYTGTIRPVNDVSNLINAAKLLQNVPDIRFHIYGDGNQLSELREKVITEKITNVELKGFVERKNIPYILSQSSVNVLHYSRNQFNWSRGNSSNKLFEYMASGKPIISSVKTGYSIIDKFECGVELEECTPEVLSQAILYIYNLPKTEREKMGFNGIKGVRHYEFNKLTDKLVEVIESVS